jgi:hypothetical protein
MTNPENQSQGQWSDPTYPPAPPAWPAPPGADPAATPGAPTYPAYQAPTPYGAPPPAYGAAPGYGAGYVMQPPTNGLAIAAMVCSLAGLITLISFPVGAVLGHIALKQVRERGEQGEGYAKTGIIVGWIGTGLFVLCCGAYIAFFASLAGSGAFVTN